MSDEEKKDVDEEGDDISEDGTGSMPDQEEVQRQMARMLASVGDMALYNMSVLASQAWHHLGLVPIPGTDTAEMDLDQAKLAIDLYEATLKVLENTVDKDQVKELKRGLMDLHMNYVNKSKKD